MKQRDYKYDAFISHAVEDKILIANEICRRLEQANLRIWYSSEELGPGDRISEKIEQGLNQSRFGIVIFTKTYVAKTYALKEFYQLLSMEKEGKSRILPVLHEISPAELAARGLEMEDRFLINTNRGLDYIIDKLVGKIHPPVPEPIVKPTIWKWLLAAIAVILISVGIYFVGGGKVDGLSNRFVETAIRSRIEGLEQKINKDYEIAMKTNSGKLVNQQFISNLYSDFQSVQSYYRNSYELDIGRKTIVAKKNVDAALGIDTEELSPFNSYSFTDPIISLLNDKMENGEHHISYSLQNTESVEFKCVVNQLNDSTQTISVAYQNYIRYIVVGLTLPTASTEIKRHQMNIYALLPEETYEFSKEDGEWVLSEVK